MTPTATSSRTTPRCWRSSRRRSGRSSTTWPRRGWPTASWCWSSASSAGASPRTDRRGPTMARPAPVLLAGPSRPAGAARGLPEPHGPGRRRPEDDGGLPPRVCHRPGGVGSACDRRKPWAAPSSPCRCSSREIMDNTGYSSPAASIEVPANSRRQFPSMSDKVCSIAYSGCQPTLRGAWKHRQPAPAGPRAVPARRQLRTGMGIFAIDRRYSSVSAIFVPRPLPRL